MYARQTSLLRNSYVQEWIARVHLQEAFYENRTKTITLIQRVGPTGTMRGGGSLDTEKHPYSPGGPGGIAATINQFRRSFPKTVNAETLKQLGIAPKNESYLINILRFIGAIDPEGNKPRRRKSFFPSTLMKTSGHPSRRW